VFLDNLQGWWINILGTRSIGSLAGTHLSATYSRVILYKKELLMGTEEKRQKSWGLVMLMLVYYLLITAEICLPTHPHTSYWATDSCSDTTHQI